MDPRVRMHLEGAYEALENGSSPLLCNDLSFSNNDVAGIALPEVMGSDTAVFVGAFNSDYNDLMVRDPGIMPKYRATGVGVSLFSNRISHWFDLRGPSVTVDTACSASMNALHMASKCLRHGDSKMAIISGANLMLDPGMMMTLRTLK